MNNELILQKNRLYRIQTGVKLGAFNVSRVEVTSNNNQFHRNAHLSIKLHSLLCEKNSSSFCHFIVVKMRSWLDELKDAKKSAIADQMLKKVLYELKDGRELVEEYDLQSNLVTRRAWKVKDQLGKQKEWDIELGDPEPNSEDLSRVSIKENASQPIVSRRNTKTSLEWRIRNLPYPIETYSITSDEEKNTIIVRTTNKKYFKSLTIPELARLNVPPRQDNISFIHKFNTLIITYKKPKELLEFEKAVLEIAKRVETKQQKFDPNSCKQS
ncbi:protein DPCD-like [Harmonia axyridis]|uniref:protein DPCD-like n=1 Tax=Harmonia axyridis TaxID=115357 RepID=UPI001E27717D|nr:protein DPCD-like [Harmonia axyridis]